MTKTISTVTDRQIAALRAEAATAGDDAMVHICDRAMGPGRDARAARLSCARVIEDARAQEDRA